MLNEVDDLKKNLELKAYKSSVDKLVKKIDDLENRSKRSNIVFWSIPEGAEEGSTPEELISDIILNHMNLERDVEIMRGHCTAIFNNFKIEI